MNKLKPIYIIIILLSLFFINACTDKQTIKTSLYKYLHDSGNAVVKEVDFDSLYFQLFAKDLQNMTSEFEILSNSLIDLSGFWECYGYKMHSLCNYSLTDGDVIKMHLTWDELRDCEVKLYKAKVSSNLVEECDQVTSKLNKLLPIWESNYQDWKVREVSENVYSLSGYGLGINSGEACIGTWYYFATDNICQPSDIYSKEISELLKIEEIREGMNKIEAIPESSISLPAKKSCSLGYMSGITWDEKEASIIKSVYGSLNKYWNMFTDMGYRVVLRGPSDVGWVIEVK